MSDEGPVKRRVIERIKPCPKEKGVYYVYYTYIHRGMHIPHVPFIMRAVDELDVYTRFPEEIAKRWG